MELEKRNISGYYFRYKNEKGEWENRCFEDLPESEQERQLQGRSEEWIKSLAQGLAKRLREISDQFDLTIGE